MRKVHFLALTGNLLAGTLLACMAVSAQMPVGEPVRMAATVMHKWNDTGEDKTSRWSYDEAVVWKGLEGCWYNTGDARYYQYIQHRVDRLVDKDGNILAYKMEDHDLGNIPGGRLLLLLYKVSNQPRYYKAARLLRRQLQEQPRTREGCFGASQPLRAGLDGVYRALPFYAEWAATFHEDSVFDDIARQLVLAERQAGDKKIGLRGGDASAAAIGRYGMALVDVLDHFPKDHPRRRTILEILDRWAAAVKKGQDPSTGLWQDEAAANCMFVYTLEKGVRMGWLPVSYRTTARNGYEGIRKKFITTNGDGMVTLKGATSNGSAGDEEGAGAFLLAAGEMEQLPTLALGKGRTVLLDYYFNNEHKKDITGATVRYHYVWEDQANSGFSFWGTVFRRHGLRTDSLPVAPTADRLKKAAVYIIVDPDNEKESPVPNYPSAEDIQAIYDWVKAGGVLLLMSNDSANAEFLHFNKLAEKFGIHFNLDDRNRVTGDRFEQGAFIMTGRDGIFNTTHKIYIKELSTLRLSDPARPRFSAPKTDVEGNTARPADKEDVIMATARIGKGIVFAVGDPWFYNEYLDGRRLPAEYENFHAATDLVRWIITEINPL